MATAAPRTAELGSGWTRVLGPELEKPYFQALKDFLVAERAGHRVYPAGRDIFHAFARTPFDAVRVVILGQDPYHRPWACASACHPVCHLLLHS